MNQEIETDLYILLCIKYTTNINSGLCGDLNGKEIQKRGDIGIPLADSLCYAAENNTL